MIWRDCSFKVSQASLTQPEEFINSTAIPLVPAFLTEILWITVSLFRGDATVLNK
jgi:hypothetical protein